VSSPDRLPPSLMEFDRGPVQIWTARSNGALDHVNQTTLDYFGRTYDEMIDWGWADLVHPEDLSETLAVSRRVAFSRS